VLPESPNPACDHSSSQARVSFRSAARDWLGLALTVYLLVAAVSIIGLGFRSAVGERATGLFEAVGNPITGLVVGLLATALVQSSSSVTSIIVGLAELVVWNRLVEVFYVVGGFFLVPAALIGLTSLWR